MKHHRYAINASNLHFGGGVQVATSVIYELSCISQIADKLAVFVSTEVDSDLQSLNFRSNCFKSYKVINRYGIGILWSSLWKQLSENDAVLTIFGPLYLLRPSFFSVVGFAQPWIIYPQNEVVHNMPLPKQLWLCLKYRVQALFFRQSNILIAELDHVRERLIQFQIANSSQVVVVHNCLSSIYRYKELWLPVSIPFSDADYKVGFLGRNYLHKNTSILPFVKRCLQDKWRLNVEFFVTFTDEEWNSCATDFQAHITNVGSLKIAQCPNFYSAMDGIIFPSLLECFSATPLEAMAMDRPLFASDRQFIRDVCREYAYYFDPMDAEDVANVIATFFLSDRSRFNKQAAEARKFAFDFACPKQRAISYFEAMTR